MDVNTGEIIAYASLPDYDPNNPVDALDPQHINRLNVGGLRDGLDLQGHLDRHWALEMPTR